MGEREITSRPRRDEPAERAISELTGVILLFGIVAVGAVLVLATGFVALEGVQERTAEEQSIQTMDAVRSGVEDVQYDQRERFEGVWAEEDGYGTMTLEVNGKATTEPLDMGVFLHESEAGLYASQAGGTWTETDTGSRMIHEPALSYTNSTVGDAEVWSLTVPPVEVDASPEATDTDAVIAGYEPSDGSVTEMLFDGLDDDEQLEQVTITIEDNPYHDAWARYLEDELPTHRDDSEVVQDGTTVVATAPLGEGRPTPDDPEQYDFERTDPPGSIATTAEELELTNALVDSYDSAARPYEDHAEEERRHGVIEASGDVDLRGGTGNEQMAVRGDVLAGGSIAGADRISPGDGTEHWDGYTEPESVGDEVDAVIADVRRHRDEVDNHETDAIDGNEFDLETGATLESGVYYLEDATVDDELELDVSGGDVVIAVDGDLTIGDDVAVTTGDSRTSEVRWFVDGNVSVEKGRTVGVQEDRAPQHWVFGSDETTTVIGGSASFTGVVYTPGSDVRIDEGSQNDRTRVYGGLVGDVEAATNAHFAYDRGLDRDPRVVGDSGIGGPNHPFDARVTLVGADFGWSPQISSFADFFDPFDALDPGERESFDVDLPDAAFEHVDDPDGELEYFQTATGTTSTVETRERTIEGETSTGLFGVGDPADDTELEVEAGETITVTADDDATAISLADSGLLFEEEIVSGTGTLEATVDETTTLELGVVTDEEREYVLEVQRTQRYEELTFDATEYDEFRVEVTSDDADFFVELREDDEVMDDTGVLFSGDARWAADAGETIDESYAAYRSTTSFDGGEGTIRIGNVEGDEPIDYEITLEQTKVDSSIFDVDGDPAWFQQFPVETELQFRNATETTTVQPWPEADVVNASEPAAAHADDVNHPAVDYPMTYEVENLSPGTVFAPNVTWRDEFCTAMDSYAGTSRSPDGGAYEDEILFEMGCSTGDDGWLDWLDPFGLFDDPEYDLNRDLDGLEYVDGGLEAESDGDRIEILEDGDRVPDVEPFEAQYTLQDMLGEKLVHDESTDTYHVDLDSGEFAILFELAPESYLDGDPTWENALKTGSDAPDFNDLVMLFEITDVHDDVTRFDESRTDYRYTLDLPDGVITADEG